MPMERVQAQRSRAQRPVSEDARHLEGTAGAPRDASALPPAMGLAPLTPNGIVQLQRAAGNHAVAQWMAAYHEERRRENQTTSHGEAAGSAPIQRMIQIGTNLYYSPAAIKQQLPGKTDKEVEFGQWRKNLIDLTQTNAVVADNAYAIPGMNVPSPTLGNALTDKLNTGATIYHYASVGQMNGFWRALQGGVPEETSPILLPKDMLDEKRDLTMKYDEGKACVLQALINLGIIHPRLEAGEQKDPKAWHEYYVRNNIMYDDDTVLYKIYSGFGLKMVWNQRSAWSNLSSQVITPGSYVFTTPGHNFAVYVNDSPDRSKRYEPLDAPQNIVTTYEPNRIITYAWRYQ